MVRASFSRPVTVFVVDDHHLVRRGIAQLLDDADGISVVGEAASGEEAIPRVRALCPDVVLMDLRMPGIGGLEAAHRISLTVPQSRIIAVTAWDQEPAHRLRRSGILALVSKSADQRELASLIRRIAAGPGAKRRDRDATEKREGDQGSPFDTLTPREMQVACMVVAGLKAADIAATLFVTAKTVHSFRYRIFAKLGVNGDVELSQLAARCGVPATRGRSGASPAPRQAAVRALDMAVRARTPRGAGGRL